MTKNIGEELFLPAACGMVLKWVKLFFLLFFLGHLAF